MKITIDIPKNDYVQPTEVRPDVVKGICEAFLADTIFDSIFHPLRDGQRKPKVYIAKYPKQKKYTRFCDEKEAEEMGYSAIRFNGAEMQAAFEALNEAGYHIFVNYDYHWYGYLVDKKPYHEGDREVHDFQDFID